MAPRTRRPSPKGRPHARATLLLIRSGPTPGVPAGDPRPTGGSRPRPPDAARGASLRGREGARLRHAAVGAAHGAGGRPGFFLNGFFRSGAGNNYAGYSSRRVDALLDSCDDRRGPMDARRRSRATSIANCRGAPVAFLLTPSWHFAWGSRIVGYEPWGRTTPSFAPISGRNDAFLAPRAAAPAPLVRARCSCSLSASWSSPCCGRPRVTPS